MYDDANETIVATRVYLYSGAIMINVATSELERRPIIMMIATIRTGQQGITSVML